MGDGDVAEGAEIRSQIRGKQLGVAGGLAVRCSGTTGMTMIVGPFGFRRRRRADYRKGEGQRRSA